jgi:hypothetical protein
MGRAVKRVALDFNWPMHQSWLKMIKGSGWAVSMVMDSTGMKSGIKASAELEN